MYFKRRGAVFNNQRLKMKKNNSVSFWGGFGLVTLLAISPVLGLNKSERVALKNAIDGVPAIQLAGKAAELVVAAPKKDKEATALTLVRAIILKNRGVAESLVSALAEALPQSAAIIAATAADLVPNQVMTIAKAASKAAPSEASKIAAALTRILPRKADQIAEAILAVVPQARAQVASAVFNAPLRIERRSAQIGQPSNVDITPNTGIGGNAKDGTPIDVIQAGYASVGGDANR